MVRLLCFASGAHLGKEDVSRARHESVFYLVFWRYISGCCCRGYQAHTHVYYQTSSLSTRGNLAHTLSIVFIPNHNKPSGLLPPSLSLSLTWLHWDVCLPYESPET